MIGILLMLAAGTIAVAVTAIATDQPLLLLPGAVYIALAFWIFISHREENCHA